jgi:predicted Fe-Mo cluster-binding NifX family protein
MTASVITGRAKIAENVVEKDIAMATEKAMVTEISIDTDGETATNDTRIGKKFPVQIFITKKNTMIKDMKIAVPVTNTNQIDGHFGHCESYKVYNINANGEISGVENIASPQGCGCKSNIAGVLAAKGVSIMLVGGIGEGAINVLKHSGIDVLRGCEGNADMVVKLYVVGKVTDSGSICQQHDHHHAGGQDHVCNH